MSKRRILLQLDTDPQPSVFDAVVAVDGGAEVLLRHGGVTPENVREHVHGTIFTRGGDDLASTAIFIGGSDVAAGEALLAAVCGTFFGPLRVSVMMDSSGSNTTAAAAVLAVLNHVKPAEATVAVLGGTGPVGQRVARLLVRGGAHVRVASRSVERAKQVCGRVAGQVQGAKLTAHAASNETELAAVLSGAKVVVAAGAAGVQMVSAATLAACTDLKLAVDLNAVPPLGIEGIEATDRGKQREGTIYYGALGVGRAKMKIHRAAITRLFEKNDLRLDAEEVLEIGRGLKL